MENISLLSQNELAKITNHRSGEIKFGEKIITIPKDADVLDFISKSDAKFVLLGIPEDIGVRANLGRAGAATAYESALQSLANIQHNKFCKGSDLIILGHLNVAEEMKKAQNLSLSTKENRKELFKLVEKLDIEVSHIIHQICSTGKIPIIVVVRVNMVLFLCLKRFLKAIFKTILILL